jgi:iron(II)-dependent oxidoreductase
MGNDDLICDDTERPAHITQLDFFNIASHPVSNAEYLGFIEDGGYQQQAYWSKQGWQWRVQNNIHKPNHWQQNAQGAWYGIEHEGAFDLADDAPVHGLSYFEACAFASWAKARLPHEYEWEAAARLNKLSNAGQVLEWCQNEFFYYGGFKQLPDMPPLITSADSHLRVLRGASKTTRPERRRITIRHANNACSRHIHAGLRLVFT